MQETWGGLLIDGTKKVQILSNQIVDTWGYIRAGLCWVPGSIACWEPNGKRGKIKKGQYYPLITQYAQQLTIADLEAFVTITWDPVMGFWHVYTKGEPDQDVHHRIEQLMHTSDEWAEIWEAWQEDQAQRRRWSYGRSIAGLVKSPKKMGPKGEPPVSKEKGAKRNRA